MDSFASAHAKIWLSMHNNHGSAHGAETGVRLMHQLFTCLLYPVLFLRYLLKPLAHAYLQSGTPDLLMACLTAVSCVIFVVSTYIPAERFDRGSNLLLTDPHDAVQAIALMDFTIALMFIMDYILNLCGSDNAHTYAFSFQGMTDLVASLPFTFLRGPLSGNTHFWPSVPRVLKLMKITRVSRITRLVRYRKRSITNSSSYSQDVSEMETTIAIVFLLIYLYGKLCT